MNIKSFKTAMCLQVVAHSFYPIGLDSLNQEFPVFIAEFLENSWRFGVGA